MSYAKHILIAAILFIQLVAVAISVPASSRANDYNNGDTVNTPWTIANSQTYTGGHLFIKNNVTIANGGVLTLDNFEFWWQPATADTIGLNVQKGGTLILKNNSGSVTSNLKKYWFQVQKGANISWTGGVAWDLGENINDPIYGGSYGILVFADNAVFESVSFDKEIVGLQFIGAKGGQVLNSSFVDTTHYGMNIINSTDTLIKGTTFSNAQALYVQDSQLTIENTKFLNNANQAIFASGGNLDIVGSTFNNTGNTYTTMTVSWGTFNVTNSTFDATATTPDAMIRSENSVGRITGSYFTNGERLYIYAYNSHLDVIGNNFLNLSYVSWSLYHIYLSRSTGNISKNKFIDKVSSVGIVCEDCTNTNVAENQFTNVSMGFYAPRFQNITIIKNTFNAIGTALEFDTGADVLVEGNTVTNTNEFIRLFAPTKVKLKDNNATIYGSHAVNSYGCQATLEGNDIKMTTSGSMAIYMGTAANIVVRKDKYDVPNGLFAQMLTMGPGHGTFRVEDTTITNADRFTVIGSHPYQVSIINTTFDPSPWKNPWSDGAFGNPGSNLYYGWWTTVEARWQNDALAPGANISVKDATGRETSLGITDTSGKLGPFPAYAGHIFLSDNVVINENLNDNVFKASFGNVNGTKAQAITGNSNVLVKMTDSEPGAINFTTLNGWATNAAPVKVEGFATDNGSGIAKVVVKTGTQEYNATLNGTQWAASLAIAEEGSYTLNATAYDVAGNAASASINIRVDRTGPTVLVNTPHFLNKENFNLEGIVDTDTMLLVIDGHLVPVANGSFIYAATVPSGSDHDFVINATDDAGNTVEVGWKVNVSTVKPTLVVDIADGTVTNQVNLHVTGSVSAGVTMVLVNGVSATIGDIFGGMAKFNATLTLLEGPNTINVTAVDLYGNALSEERTVVLDTVAPMLDITSPEGLTATINTDTLTVEGTVTEVDTISILGRSFNVTNGTFVAEVAGLQDGENQVLVEARDVAGNIASVALTIFVDTIPPRVAITSPSSPLYTNKNTVQVEGTVEDGATLFVNGVQANYTNGTFIVSVPISNGTTQIEVKAIDLAGNEGKAVLAVFYDIETSLTISEDVETSTSEATTVITGVAEPGSTVTINDIPVQVAPDGSFNATVALEEGKNTFIVKVTDRAGNTAEKTIEIERAEELGFLAVGADLAILLMVVGIVIGGACGYVIGKRSRNRPTAQRPPPQRATPPAQTQPKSEVVPVVPATAKAKPVAADEEEDKIKEGKEEEEEKEEEDEEEEEEKEEAEEKDGDKDKEEEDEEVEEEDDEGEEERTEKAGDGNKKDDDDLDDLLKELDSK